LKVYFLLDALKDERLFMEVLLGEGGDERGRDKPKRDDSDDTFNEFLVS
jgi:hypothetical protein